MEPEQAKQLNESMAQVLDWLKDTAEKGESFVLEQAPLVCQEVVAWHFWSNAIAAGSFAVGAIASIWAARWLINAIRRQEAADKFNMNTPPLVFALIFVVFGAVGFSAGSLCTTGAAVKACVAPRLVIIEKVAGLLK